MIIYKYYIAKAILLYQSPSISLLNNKYRVKASMDSSYGVHTTGTKRKAEKIDIYFDDKIKSMKVNKMSLFPWIRID